MRPPSPTTDIFFQAGGQYGQPHTESCLRGDGGHEISVGFFKPQLDSSRGHLGGLSTGFVPHPQSLSSLRFLPALSCRCGCPKSVPRSAASEILGFCPCFSRHATAKLPLASLLPLQCPPALADSHMPSGSCFNTAPKAYSYVLWQSSCLRGATLTVR